MDLATLGLLLAGLGVALVWITLYATLQFTVTQAIASKITNSDYAAQQILRTSTATLLKSLFSSTAAVLSTLITTTLRLVRKLYSNRLNFLFGIVAFALLLTVYFLQVPTVETVVIGYQTVVSPLLHKLIYPLLNILSMLGSIIVAFMNFLVQIATFIMVGIPKIIIGCLLNQDLYSLLISIMEVFHAFIVELTGWIITNPFISRYNTGMTTAAIGNLLQRTTGAGNCTCAAVFFVYEDAVNLVNSPEFIVTFDATVNTVLSLAQRLTPLPLLFGQSSFTLEPFASEAPIAINGLGNLLLLAIKLFVNSIYGFFDTQNALPMDIQDFLSQPLLEPGTQLVSGFAILLNITLEATKNAYSIYSGPATGLPYLQFEKVVNRLRLSARAFGSYFILLGPNVVDAVTKTLLVGVELIGFIADFAPQVIYYVFYPPIQNPLKFMVIYYQNPDNRLLKVIVASYLAADEIGLVVNLANVPTGHAITGILSTTISLIQIIVEILFYSYNLFGFVNDVPTYTTISTGPLFASLVLTNEALGDFIRQFDPDFCFDPITNKYVQDTTVCAYSTAQTAFIDMLISITANIVRFLQTFLSALTLNPPNFTNVDIPEFDLAITRAEQAGCAFSRAVLLLLPIDAPCTFSDATAKDVCGTGQTCAATVLCEIWETFLSIFRIANDFFIKLREGKKFDSYTKFFSSAIKQLIDDGLTAFKSLGLLLDCLICRVANPGGTSCSSLIYGAFTPIAEAFSSVVELVTGIFFDVIILVFAFFKNLFVDGQIIKALIDFTIGIVNLIIKLATTFFKFVIDWLDKVGLGAIASVFRVFDLAFCNIVKVITKIIYFFIGQTAPKDPQCTSLSDIKRAMSADSIGTDTDYIDTDQIMAMFPGMPEIKSNPAWADGSDCPDVIERLSQSDLTDPGTQKLLNNALYCTALLYWDDYVESESHRKIAFENLCDYVMTDVHGDQPNWSSMTPVDRGTILQCLQGRYFMDFVRNHFNATYLPRDLRTNPLRFPVYGAEIILDFARISHYYYDQKSLPGQIRDMVNIRALNASGINTTYITAHEDMSDREFGTYLDSLTLRDYLMANNPTHPEEIIAIDEFGRLIFNGGIDAIARMLEVGIGDIEVSLGTAILGSPDTTTRSMGTLVYDIITKSYKVVTIGVDTLAGTPQKRAALGNGGVRIVEGLNHLVSGISNVTAAAINSYGTYRDRLARINGGTASEQDHTDHQVNAVWWEGLKNNTFPWRWPVYNKPNYLRARERDAKMDAASCSGNFTCDIASTVLHMDNMRKSKRHMHPQQKTFARHFEIISESIDRLLTPTAEAQDRYDTAAKIVTDSIDYFYLGYRDGTTIANNTKNLHFNLPRVEGMSLESVHASSLAGQTFQNIFIGPPQCMSNYVNVCEKCLALDNGIATTLAASGSLLAYINGPFQRDMQARRDFLQYTYDDNAPVRVGQQPGLPIWFPLPTVNSYRYIGPPENITTIGFSDYMDIITLLPSSDGIIRDNITPGSFYDATFKIFDSIAHPLISRIEGLFRWFSSGTEDGTAEETSIIGKVVDDLLLCDYTSELDGSKPRFSVPISMVYSLLVLTISSLVFRYVLDVGGFMNNFLPASMIAIFSFLYFGWNWSALCYPATPTPLSGQVFETIAYTYLPKCLYYATGVLEEGHYHSNLYCSSIDLVADVRAYSCRLDGQFYDVFAHLAFTTVNFWPGGIEYLREITYISGYVDTYLAVDMSDPVLYSFTHTCNVGFGIINIGLVIFGLFTSSLLSEFLAALLGVAFVPVYLLFDILNTNYLVLTETDYLISIVSDRVRVDDNEIVGEPISPPPSPEDTPSVGGDTFVIMDLPDTFESTDEFTTMEADADETTPMISIVSRSRNTNSKGRSSIFGVRRPNTKISANDATFDRL